MKKETTKNPDALIKIIEQIKENYQCPIAVKKRRGRQRKYSGLSFLLLAVVAVITRTYKDSELHKLLSKDDKLRQSLKFETVPHRTTIGRRLNGQIEEAQEQINAFGNIIMKEIKLEAESSEVSAIDGRMYEAVGPAWHKSNRQEGIVPVELRNVDIESSWSKSGYRGWVQGYRLMVQTLVWPQPVPIFAAWSANNENEAAIATMALENGDLKVTDVMLGDTTFAGLSFPAQYAQAGGWLLTSKHLPLEHRSWKDDLYAYRKQTIELLFQRVIQSVALKQCQVKGLGRNGAFVLASVWLYQVLFLLNYISGLPVALIKDLIDEARWRIVS